MDREHDTTRQTWTTPQLRTADAATTEFGRPSITSDYTISSFYGPSFA